MAITNGYLTLDDLKAELGLDLNDATYDSRLEQIIVEVSRYIDDHCGQYFWTTESDETRYFRSREPECLRGVGPLISITSLATDEDGSRLYATTWAVTDYDLWPYNAAANGRPYYRIDVAPQGRYTFPRQAKGVKIVGKFGWAAIPAPVKRACILQCSRLFKRKDAPFGVVGSSEMGYTVVTRLDPDVLQLLDEYVL